MRGWATDLSSPNSSWSVSCKESGDIGQWGVSPLLSGNCRCCSRPSEWSMWASGVLLFKGVVIQDSFAACTDFKWVSELCTLSVHLSCLLLGVRFFAWLPDMYMQISVSDCVPVIGEEYYPWSPVEACALHLSAILAVWYIYRISHIFISLWWPATISTLTTTYWFSIYFF